MASDARGRAALQPMGWVETTAWYGAGGLAMLVTTATIIPALLAIGARPRIAWFAAATPVFAALVLASALALAREGVWGASPGIVRARLRLRPLTRGDWRLAGVALALSMLGAGAVAGLYALASRWLGTGLDLLPAPHFLEAAPLQAGERWVLLVWLPFFALNILGEELAWRGVLLPRQEACFGARAWLVNGGGWLLFHVCFGAQVMLYAAPMMLAQAWACQRSGNTWVGVVVHGAFNGLGFIALALLG